MKWKYLGREVRVRSILPIIMLRLSIWLAPLNVMEIDIKVDLEHKVLTSIRNTNFLLSISELFINDTGITNFIDN